MTLRPNWPASLQIADTIVERIKDGTYQPGDQLPPITEMMSEFGVTNKTVQKARKKLVEDGWIYAVPGMGTYVSLELPKPPDQK